MRDVIARGCAGLLLATAVGLAAGAGVEPATARDATPCAAPSAQPTDTALRYDDWFTDEAVRPDLFHTGTDRESSYSLDEIVFEPVWPGTRRYMLDPFAYGTYRLRVTDAASGREIFRQGYATLFEEWMGTQEAAQGVRRTMSESVRFPWPRKPVVLHIDNRQRSGAFRQVFSLPIDPGSHQISRAKPFGDFKVVDLAGAPHSC
jgi:hypothetical protein